MLACRDKTLVVNVDRVRSEKREKPRSAIADGAFHVTVEESREKVRRARAEASVAESQSCHGSLR